MTKAQRVITAASCAALLAQAGIPAHGPNKLPLLSREGNRFTREDGTQVRIFNVLAFATTADAIAASNHWKAGAALEKADDVEGAQVEFKAAYNQLMSFSVLEANADAFAGNYEVVGIVEDVPASKANQANGILTVVGFNRPRPVAVTSNISKPAGALFTMEEAPAATIVKAKKVKAATAAA